MPAPAKVGARAARILDQITDHEYYERLTSSSMKYSTCWSTFTGYPVIANWDLDRDAQPLLEEALKVLALKAAVYDLTGDETAAELLVPSPIDEMVHAVLAQFTVMTRIQRDLGVTFVHATELERFTYNHGGLTDQYYQAAWPDALQPQRYWLGSAEIDRRLQILEQHYTEAGIRGLGRSHTLDFATA